ncbi:protein MHF2 homolog isoform X1 [Mangifera indica]|uniref:protein MHF2 homolog isoform X1 n=1 Tax=Mangifera indica TaxID=29780 RepID=UPI001CFC2FF5|nr:protein MHF2 homolog isoform X1 [Mangifera indica]
MLIYKCSCLGSLKSLPQLRRVPTSVDSAGLEVFTMKADTFDPDLIHAIFKQMWTKRYLERERNGGNDAMDSEVGAGTSKKNRPTSGNANAVKLSCELLRLFVSEAVQRSAAIAEAEGVSKIEATHLERILPQLLLDF